MTPRSPAALPPCRSAIPPSVHGLAWGALALLILGLAAVDHRLAGADFWRDWMPSAELRHPAYAEAVHPADFFRTRANTWSNLAYVLVGFYALALAAWDARRGLPAGAGYLVRTPSLGALFGFACVYLGLASGFFHASLTRTGQQWDVASMYAPLIAGIALDLGRWYPCWRIGRRSSRPATWPVLAGGAVVACALLNRYKWSMRSGVVLPTLILAAGVGALLNGLTGRWRWNWWWLLPATFTLVAARLCWQWDVAGKFSGPTDWWQGHAIWHLLTAASLACLYAHHRAESPRVPGAAAYLN